MLLTGSLLVGAQEVHLIRSATLIYSNFIGSYNGNGYAGGLLLACKRVCAQ